MFFSFNSRCLGFRRMHSLGTGALGAGCSEAVGAPGSALTFIGKMYIYTPKPNICYVWRVFFYMFFHPSPLTPNDSL